MKLKKTAIEQFVIEKVKEKRIALGLSQADLAALINISSGYIGKVESTNFPSKYNLNHINSLSLVLKCSPKDFLPDNPI